MSIQSRIAVKFITFIILLLFIFGLLKSYSATPSAFSGQIAEHQTSCDQSGCVYSNDPSCSDNIGACRRDNSLEDRLKHFIRKLFKSNCLQDCDDDFSLEYYIKLAISVAITVTIFLSISIRIISRFIGELKIKVKPIIVEMPVREYTVRSREDMPSPISKSESPSPPSPSLAPAWSLLVLLFLFIIIFLYLWHQKQ